MNFKPLIALSDLGFRYEDIYEFDSRYQRTSQSDCIPMDDPNQL